jgi:hypothetical protein
MANSTVTGTVIIRLDGTSIRSKAGAKLNMGGEERVPVYADGVLIGFSAKPMAAVVTATLAHTSTSDLAALRDTTDSSLLFETDTGVRFSIRGAFLTKPPELTGGEGDVAVEFTGQPAQQQ